MRNLKRVLSLVLAAMMLLGMMVIGASAAGTTEGGYESKLGDYDTVTQGYKEAVSVIEGLHIIKGYEDGDFHPTDILQRDQAAKIIAYMLLGEKKAEALNPNTTHFTDIPAGYWAAGYIDYCVTKGILAGYGDGTFGPHDTLTGYQFGKMLLVAMGYNAEIEGYANDDNYITNISVDMIENDIYVPDVLIVEPVSREVAAKMAFNTLTRPTMVDYTYQHFVQVATPVTTGENLGEYVFGLNDGTPRGDDWGRPYTVWTATKNAPSSTVATYYYPMVASYTQAQDECDIYADIIPSGNGKLTILDYWKDGNDLDGEDASNDGIAEINSTDTAHHIGAQGRQTEIYDMGSNNVWIVEINTYLAKVTGVTPSKTDKNGHSSPRMITLEIYTDTPGAAATVTKTTATLANDVYDVGDHVLVSINKPTFNDDGKQTGYDRTRGSVTILQSAPVVATGQLTSYTSAVYPDPATSTVGSVKLNEADQFILNWRTATQPWGAFADQYGNVIGLDKATESYAVIERIAWQHQGLDSGYAAANLVMADGTKVSGVTVSKLNGSAVKNTEDKNEVGATATSNVITDDWTTNTALYDHVVTYSIDPDGNYIIDQHADPATTPIADNDDSTANYGAIVKGDGNIWDDVGTQNSATAGNGTLNADRTSSDGDTILGMGTSKTVYLIRNNRGTYDVYTGKDNIPDMTGASICVVSDDDGYATLVVVNGTAATTSNTKVVYVPVNAKANRIGQVKFGTDDYNVYMVYPLGEIAPITVYDKDTSSEVLFDSTNGVDHSGLYQITLDSRNIVTAAVQKSTFQVKDMTATAAAVEDKVDGLKYSYRDVYAERIENGTSLIATEWSGTWNATTQPTHTTAITPNFNLRSDCKYIEVVKAGYAATDKVTEMRLATASDIKQGDQLILGYKTIGGAYYVDYVYIIRVEGATTTPVSPTGTVGSIKGINAKTSNERLSELVGEDDGLYGFTNKPDDYDTTATITDVLFVKMGWTYADGQITVQVRDAQGKLKYQESHGPAEVNEVLAKNANYVVVSFSVAGSALDKNQGSGELMRTALTEGKYTVTVLNGSNTVKGTFTFEITSP